MFAPNNDNNETYWINKTPFHDEIERNKVSQDVW